MCTLLSNAIDMICAEVNLSWDEMRSTQEIAYIKKTLLNLPRIENLNLTEVAFSDLVHYGNEICSNFALVFAETQTPNDRTLPNY